MGDDAGYWDEYEYRRDNAHKSEWWYESKYNVNITDQKPILSSSYATLINILIGILKSGKCMNGQ